PGRCTPSRWRGCDWADLFGGALVGVRLSAVFFLPWVDLRALASPGVFRKGKPFLFLRYPADGAGRRVATARPRLAALWRPGCQLPKYSNLFRHLTHASGKRGCLSRSDLILPVDRPSLSVSARARPRLLRLFFLLLQACLDLRRCRQPPYLLSRGYGDRLHRAQPGHSKHLRAAR